MGVDSTTVSVCDSIISKQLNKHSPVDLILSVVWIRVDDSPLPSTLAVSSRHDCRYQTGTHDLMPFLLEMVPFYTLRSHSIHALFYRQHLTLSLASSLSFSRSLSLYFSRSLSLYFSSSLSLYFSRSLSLSFSRSLSLYFSRSLSFYFSLSLSLSLSRSI